MKHTALLFIALSAISAAVFMAGARWYQPATFQADWPVALFLLGLLFIGVIATRYERD